MNRDIAVAADRLARAVRESEPCDEYSREENETCQVMTLSEAANELLDELRRAGVIGRVP